MNSAQNALVYRFLKVIHEVCFRVIKLKMSRGVLETEELQKNLESQLERIMSQLEDIETMK